MEFNTNNKNVYTNWQKFLFPFSYPLCNCNKQRDRDTRERRTGGIFQSYYPSLILNTVPASSTSVPFSEAFDHGNLQMTHKPCKAADDISPTYCSDTEDVHVREKIICLVWSEVLFFFSKRGWWWIVRVHSFSFFACGPTLQGQRKIHPLNSVHLPSVSYWPKPNNPAPTSLFLPLSQCESVSLGLYPLAGGWSEVFGSESVLLLAALCREALVKRRKAPLQMRENQ